MEGTIRLNWTMFGFSILLVIAGCSWQFSGIVSQFQKPSARELFTAAASLLKAAAPYRIGMPAGDIPLFKTLPVPADSAGFWGIDGMLKEPRAGVSCGQLDVVCVLLYRGDVLAYKAGQTFDSERHYINFTLIPASDPTHPGSLLVFPNGRVTTGSHAADGSQGRSGLTVIQPDPAYLKGWQPAKQEALKRF